MSPSDQITKFLSLKIRILRITSAFECTMSARYNKLLPVLCKIFQFLFFYSNLSPRFQFTIKMACKSPSLRRFESIVIFKHSWQIGLNASHSFPFSALYRNPTLPKLLLPKIVRSLLSFDFIAQRTRCRGYMKHPSESKPTTSSCIAFTST